MSRAAQRPGVFVLIKPMRRCLLATLMLMTSACGFHDVEYPANWKPIDRMPHFGCDDLTGVYGEGDFVSDASNSYSPSPPFRVFRFFFDADQFVPLRMPKLTDTISRVEIVGPRDGVMRITAIGGDRVLLERTMYEHHQFACAWGGTVRIKPHRRFPNIIPLQLTQDNSIVVHFYHPDCAVIGIIPWCSPKAGWYRLDKGKQTPASLAAKNWLDAVAR